VCVLHTAETVFTSNPAQINLSWINPGFQSQMNLGDILTSHTTMNTSQLLRIMEL